MILILGQDNVHEIVATIYNVLVGKKFDATISTQEMLITEQKQCLLDQVDGNTETGIKVVRSYPSFRATDFLYWGDLVQTSTLRFK